MLVIVQGVDLILAPIWTDTIGLCFFGIAHVSHGTESRNENLKWRGTEWERKLTR